MIRSNYKSSLSKIASNIGPIIVWVMVALIPSIIGTQIFKYIDKTKQEIKKAKSQQNLLTEAYKYNKYLNTKKYLNQVLDTKQTNKLYKQWIDNEMPFNKLRQNHSILIQLPTFKGNIEQELHNFCKLLQLKLGALPNAAFIFSQNLDECSYFIKSPFGQDFSANTIKKALNNGYRRVINRLVTTRKNENLDKELSRYRYKEINQSLGLLQAMHVDLYKLTEKYSMATNDFIFPLSYVVETDKHEIKLLLLVYDTLNISSARMINHALKIANNSNFHHTFGWSKSPSLPIFQNIDDNEVLICALPEQFQKLCKKRQFAKQGYQPVIRILAKNSHDSVINYKTILFVTKLYLMLTFLFSIGFSLNQFSIFRSLKKMMIVAFIAGILFPVTSLIWLSLSYLFVHDERVSESQQLIMKIKINETEDGLRLEKFKQNSFVRAVANKIEKFSYKKRNNSHKYIPFNEATKKSSKFRWNFHSLLAINGDGTTFFRYRDKQGDIPLNEGGSVNFLKGPFLQALSRLNAFHLLSVKKRKKMLQIAEVLIEMIEGMFDPNSVGELLARSGDFITQEYTVDETYLNTFILRNAQNKPNGICTFNSNNNGWLNKFKENYQGKEYYKPFKKYYKENGFLTALYLLETDKRHEREIRTVSGQDKEMNMINISEIAASLLAKSDTSQINNLNHAIHPHLIVGEFLPDLHIYAIAYSVPTKSSGTIMLSVSIIILILLILISAIALAQGVASVLLVNVPQFSDAISKSENQNYQWHININSGNEFEELANAFNGMASKMQERQKLGELVSQNVIDAISSDNEEMLKPGGERVNASILFADIRSFTSISETYSADEVVEMLNGYFTIMSEIIEKHGGIIDKFIGDAIQAVFYDNRNTTTSLRAIDAAVEMLSALTQFNIQRKNANKFQIDNGIGITTGQIISGRVGTAEGKLDATVIGSNLTYAMELESLSKFARKTPILIDKNTKDLILSKYSTLDFIAPEDTQLSISMYELQIK